MYFWEQIRSALCFLQVGSLPSCQLSLELFNLVPFTHYKVLNLCMDCNFFTHWDLRTILLLQTMLELLKILLLSLLSFAFYLLHGLFGCFITFIKFEDNLQLRSFLILGLLLLRLSIFIRNNVT